MIYDGKVVSVELQTPITVMQEWPLHASLLFVSRTYYCPHAKQSDQLLPQWTLISACTNDSLTSCCCSGQVKRTGGACPFLQAKTKAKDNFKEAILAQPIDVEELGRLGRRKKVCPYYTARSGLPEAQLVLLPYSALLAQVCCSSQSCC